MNLPRRMGQRGGPALALFLAATSQVVFAANPAEDLFDLDNLVVRINGDLPYVEVQHKGKPVTIMRRQDPAHSIDPPYDQTARPCPPFCIQPMMLAPGVETIGELELIDYLKRIAAGDDGVLVIDSRVEEEAARGTIPGSVNLPYTRLYRATASAEEITAILTLDFNAIQAAGLWDFSPAKTLVLFCNGPWCGQSPTNIKALLSYGYPADKLKWYRGGMQAWEQFGLTTVGE